MFENENCEGFNKSENDQSANKLETTTNSTTKKEAALHLRCAQCGRSFLRSETNVMPFCSKRCQMIDLGFWLQESYGLPYEGERSGLETSYEDEE